jgi:diacylglycerol kinase family enzyme
MLLRRAFRVAPRVDLIVNRLARRLSPGSPILAALEAEVAASAGRARLHATSSLSELEAAVSAVRERGTDAVVIAGGDGSYLAGTTALARAFGDAMPVVGFAPGGTVSTVARNWGLEGSLPSYATRLVRSLLADEAIIARRPTLRVTDDRGGDRVGFIFGAGLVARFFDAYYEAPSQGYASAAVLVARVFAGTFTSGTLAARVLTPGPATLVVDGQPAAPRAWSLIAASVVKDLGLHMHLLYRAAQSTTAFHVVASPLPPRALAPQVGRVLLGMPLRGEGHVDALARELLVDLGEGAAGSTYVLDGDRMLARRVSVTPGPVLRHASAPRPRRGPT